jgi:hypothetical protein
MLSACWCRHRKPTIIGDYARWLANYRLTRHLFNLHVSQPLPGEGGAAAKTTRNPATIGEVAA